MAANSKIQWTDATWNVAVGCDKVSPGCKYCYMMRDFGGRFGKEVNGTVTRTKPATFRAPLKWQREGRVGEGGRKLLVFTSSLTDLFHPAIDAYREEAWGIIRQCPDLVFQILTKRPERVLECLPEDWGEGWENVWVGVSAEDQQRANDRIPMLAEIPAKVKFVSFEPLLGEITLRDVTGCEHYEDGILPYHWAIVGGESGNGSGIWRYRYCYYDWIYKLIYHHKDAGVPVFLKQFGTHIAKESRFADRHGGNPEEWDARFRWARQFPEH